MPDAITIEAAKREETGSTKVGRLRREGLLPCIVNSSDGRSDPIKVPAHAFKMLLKEHGRDNLIADLVVDGGKPSKVILKDIQYDPVTGRMIHADFAEISMTEKMTVSIAIELTGDPIGVLEQDGMLRQALWELEVECLPGDIVESIAVDVSALNVGDTIHVSDIETGDKLTVLAEPETAVATVAAQLAEEEPAEEAEEGDIDGEAAEPEVIGEDKEEEAAEEAEPES